MTDLFNLPPERLMLVAIFAMMAVIALYALAVVAKAWGHRMRKGGGVGAGLNLKELDRQRRTGEVTPEEYEAIARRLAGKDGPAAVPPRRPIKDGGAPAGGPPAQEDRPPDEPAGPEGSRRNG